MNMAEKTDEIPAPPKPETKKKQRYEKYIVYYVVVVIVIAATYMAYVYFGSTQSNLVLDEYGKRMDTYYKDVSKYNGIVNVWNDKLEYPDALVLVARNYVNEYQIIDSHNSEFLSFIQKNEDGLRNEGVDVYSMKTQVSDFRI
jgi:hypothetical protein